MAKPTLKFRLNGQVYTGRPETPTAKKIRAVLDALPDGDFLEGPKLAERTGVSYRTIRSEIYRTTWLDGYCATVKNPHISLWWGNPRSIRELKKHKELLA